MVHLGPLGPLDGPPFDPDWSLMDVSCACWRQRCRHQRDLERQTVEQRVRDEQLAALTDEDRAWLAEMGWRPPSWSSWIDSERIRG